MKFGLQHQNYTLDGKEGKIFDALRTRARGAEEYGFDSFWVMDHLLQIPSVGTIDQPMLEGWTTISSLIGVTKKIRLGTLVTGNIYPEPGPARQDGGYGRRSERRKALHGGGGGVVRGRGGGLRHPPL